ncbi:unnamed protein product [Eruca vesicaria subsp. sativa]|uniref:Uncharacterized protein n=1 Tax=Eruca vesicaria subsp. sativa TaxID=29727 RepID=A0ABC8KW05_ERUVS|nr:unnamed protein product [Eruca vesicaria subsp. sativa]
MYFICKIHIAVALGSVFPYLEHLELCTCSPGWANLLASILNDAPRLQSLTLKIKSNHSAPFNDPMNRERLERARSCS